MFCVYRQVHSKGPSSHGQDEEEQKRQSLEKRASRRSSFEVTIEHLVVQVGAANILLGRPVVRIVDNVRVYTPTCNAAV